MDRNFYFQKVAQDHQRELSKDLETQRVLAKAAGIAHSARRLRAPAWQLAVSAAIALAMVVLRRFFE